MSFLTPQVASRNYSNELRKTLQTQIALQPQVYQAQSQFAPLWNSLNLQNMQDFLMGTGDSDYATYAWQAPIYKTRRGTSGGGMSMVPGMPGMGMPGMGGGGGFDMPGMGGGMGLPGMDGGGGFPGMDMFGGNDGGGKKLISKGRYVSTGTAHRAGQRGFLDLYENEIIPKLDEAQRRSLSYQREGDIADVNRLGPQMLAALRSSNPDAARLLDSLNSDAQAGMDAGASLDPSLRREVSQAVRAGQSARGMGMGPVDVFTEALQTGSAGEALRASRRSNAANTVLLDQQFYGNPFQTILNRNAAGAAAAPGVSGQAGAMSQIGQLFNPESNYANSVYDFNANAKQSAYNADANNKAAITSALISSLGSTAGGAMKFGM